MSVYVDTSAWFALASATDEEHQAAREIYEDLVDRNEELITTSYVLAETMGLIQRRLGWRPLELFAEATRTLDVVWIDDVWHQEAETILLSRRRRDITIVDAAGFVVMRRLDLRAAFAFDDDFTREGLEVLSPPDR